MGITSEEVDKAIRAWGAKTTDPYEAGLAALYARKYDKATTDLPDLSPANLRRNYLPIRRLRLMCPLTRKPGRGRCVFPGFLAV